MDTKTQEKKPSFEKARGDGWMRDYEHALGLLARRDREIMALKSDAIEKDLRMGQVSLLVIDLYLALADTKVVPESDLAHFRARIRSCGIEILDNLDGPK